MPLLTVQQEGITPIVTRPDPARVVAGDPVHSSWVISEADGLAVRIWSSTPGKWRVAYDAWEYFHILEGHSVLTSEDGTTTDLRAGSRHVIQPGFRGTWEVLETTTKDYAVRI